ncbi:unnamed protein product, partial [Mesorhabditis belari]|uniref:Protein kinase domain-containing protein n=1 Tax=Mesorhabditis belari TaxID=2138241 RepID=A0AAF3FJP7_9BILA
MNLILTNSQRLNNVKAEIRPCKPKVDDLKIRVPWGYVPDLSDKYYRRDQNDESEKSAIKENLKKDEILDQNDESGKSETKENSAKDQIFHGISKGNFSDIISAKLYYPYVDWNQNKEISGEIEKDTKNWLRVAIKRYKIDALEKTFDGFTRLRREIQICRFQRHENIVTFYEAFPEKIKLENEGGKEKLEAIWLVSERMDHTLEKYYEHRKANAVKNVDIRHLGALLTQLLRALDYLHQRGIMHRDVTPRNIGMNQIDFQIKLLDFGLSREINPNLDHSTNVETPFIYKPIEVLMKARYNTKVDIWATALVALEMFDLKLFMPTGDDKTIEMKIRKRGAENVVKDQIFQVLGVPPDQYKSAFDRPVPESPCEEKLTSILEDYCKTKNLNTVGPLTGEDFRDLIKMMLEPDMMKRPTADDCLKHGFLRILNIKYQQRSLNSQPRSDEDMRKRNDKDRTVLEKEFEAGFTKLSFQVDLENEKT